ncbi:MAG: PTS glucitol/sorbitol transporter subunit IIB [Bilifractor sp.]|jgi:PTS system glucitol/sorbitol-specific IIB component
MSEYRSIKIVRGSAGFGGPLIITPTEEKHTVMYITGGGAEPECLKKICELSGMDAVDGFHGSAPENTIAMVIIDCGGTLRCGIYPKKGIPTVNIMPTGKSGPMAQYIKEDIYVSAVTSKQVSLASDSEAASVSDSAPDTSESNDSSNSSDEKVKFTADQKVSETLAKKKNKSWITSLGLGVGKIVNTFYQAARNAVQTCITTLLPFMGFVSLLIGIINGTGFGEAFANLLTPLAGNIWGLLILGIICSIPGLSALLGPGAVIAQIVGTLVGVEIGKGNIAPQLALPALFAINTQGACDFIPVGLGLAEAEPETIEVGVLSVMYSRFITGWLRVLIAYFASFGLYSAA